MCEWRPCTKIAFVCIVNEITVRLPFAFYSSVYTLCIQVVHFPICTAIKQMDFTSSVTPLKIIKFIWDSVESIFWIWGSWNNIQFFTNLKTTWRHVKRTCGTNLAWNDSLNAGSHNILAVNFEYFLSFKWVTHFSLNPIT